MLPLVRPLVALFCLAACASTASQPDATTRLDATVTDTVVQDAPPDVAYVDRVLADGQACPPCAPCDWYCRDAIVVRGAAYQGGGENMANYERPNRMVQFGNPWFAGRYEVTNSAYRACVAAGQCPRMTPMEWADSAPGYSEREAYDDHPAVNLTWYAARAVCRFLGAELMTSAEWELVARSNDERIYPWGDDPRCDTGWFRTLERPDGTRLECDRDTRVPRRVGSFEFGRGPFGTYDLIGNVREATLDYASTLYNVELSNLNGLGPWRCRFDPLGPRVGFPNPLDHVWRGGDHVVGGPAWRVYPLEGESREQRWESPVPLGARCRWGRPRYPEYDGNACSPPERRE